MRNTGRVPHRARTAGRRLNCGGGCLPVWSPAMESAERATRRVRIGRLEVGAGAAVAVQSMCATKTRDIDATVAQVRATAPRRGRHRAHRRRQRQGGRRRSRRSARQTEGVTLVRRPAGELSRRGRGRRRTSTRSATTPDTCTTSSATSRSPDKVAWLAQVARDTRLCHPHRRQLRLGGARVPRPLSRRSARGARPIGALPLRADGATSASSASSCR